MTCVRYARNMLACVKNQKQEENEFEKLQYVKEFLLIFVIYIVIYFITEMFSFSMLQTFVKIDL